MSDEWRHRLVWGWLRLLLGWSQMALAAAAAVALLAVGFHVVTWALVIGATTATAVSRLLYHGRPDPELTKEGKHDE